MAGRIIRLLLAFLIAIALYVQMREVVHAGNSVVNFFSFFTVQSNVIAIFALLWPNPVFRGAATIYITITGVVYATLLSGLEAALQMTIGWVNVVLHYVSPSALVLWWIAAPPTLARNYAKLIPLWMLYPSAYLAYTLLRGAQTTWYPYGFLDPVREGWGIVILFSICVTVAVIALSWLAILRAAAKRADSTS